MCGWGGSPVLAPHYLLFFALKHGETPKQTAQDHSLLSHLSWESRILVFLVYIKQNFSLPALSLRNYEAVLWLGWPSETLIFSDFLPSDPSPLIGGDSRCGQSGEAREAAANLTAELWSLGIWARWPAAVPGFPHMHLPWPVATLGPL